MMRIALTSKNIVSCLLVILGLFLSTVFCYNDTACPEFNANMCNGAQMYGCNSVCDCWSFGFYGYSAEFGGVACETPLCFTSELDLSVADFDQYVCSGNGDCISANNCQCKPGFTGYKCQYEIKDVFCNNVPSNSSLVCSGKGNCNNPDSCLCEKGYEGNNCQNFQCYGHSNTDSQVCSGRGSCIGWNTCSCRNGYYGDVCDQGAVCFGIASNDASVCGGRGSCVGEDFCICSQGYFGSQCQNSYCFSIPQNDSNVCNGRGYCNDKDTCVCSSSQHNLISGNECEFIQCKGKGGSFFDALDYNNTCSGNGICTSSGCNCSDGYTGEYCQEYSCFGISKDSSSSCSSHGTCVSNDVCSCFSNSTHGYWYGDDCIICQPSHKGSDCLNSNCDRDATCNSQGDCSTNNTCICDDGFKGEFCNECANDRYGWDCKQSCSRASTCLGHGECSRDGLFCECDNSLSAGFWKGINCSTCADGYFGESCSTKVGSSYSFNTLGNEIYFTLHAPSSFLGGAVDCSKLFSASSYSDIGSSDATCIYKTPEFPTRISIELPSSATIKPGDSLQINLKVFDSLYQPLLLSTLTNTSSVISSPEADIVVNTTVVSNSDGISLIGRNRQGIPRERTLFFEWRVLSTDPSLSSLDTFLTTESGIGKSSINVSNSDLPSNIPVSIQLRIQNVDFKIWSAPTVVNIFKESKPKYELYFYPPSDPIILTEFIMPVGISYEILENGVPLDTTTVTIDSYFDPDVQRDDSGNMISIFTVDTSESGIIYLDGYFSFMKDAIVTWAVNVSINGVPVVSSTLRIRNVNVYKPLISTEATSSGAFFNISRLNGKVLQQSYWECIARYHPFGKCESDIDAYFKAGNNKQSIFIPNYTYLKYKSTFYVRAYIVANGFSYRVQAYQTVENGLQINEIETGSHSVPTIIDHIFIDRAFSTLKLFYNHSEIQLTNTPIVTLIDQAGNNLTDLITVDTNSQYFKIEPSQIPSQTTFLSFSLSYVDTLMTYTKNLFAFVDTYPSANCSASIVTEQVPNAVFNGDFYLYNITIPCVTNSLQPRVQIILKNQGTELVACDRDPIMPSSQTCFLMLPELIGPTEVYIDIISAEDSFVPLLPVSQITERVLVGNLRESLSTPPPDIEAIQKMFNEFFTNAQDIKTTSANLRNQIRKLLYLHYPEKELSYPNFF